MSSADLTAVEWALIRDQVDKAPPLTEQQIREIAAVLNAPARAAS